MQEFLFNKFKFAISNDLSWKMTHIESGITTSSTLPQLFFSTNEESHLQISASRASISVKRKQIESIDSIADFISCSDQMDGISLEAEYAFPLNSNLLLFRFKFTNNRADTIRFNSINMVGI